MNHPYPEDTVVSFYRREQLCRGTIVAWYAETDILAECFYMYDIRTSMDVVYEVDEADIINPSIVEDVNDSVLV